MKLVNDSHKCIVKQSRNIGHNLIWVVECAACHGFVAGYTNTSSGWNAAIRMAVAHAWKPYL